MEKLVVTKRKGGSIESRSQEAYPLQPGYALEGKKDHGHGVGVSLERRSERPTAPTQGCHRHNQAVPYRSGRQPGGGSAAVPAQREQTRVEPESHDVWGTHQSLLQSRTTAPIEIGSQSKQVLHQELDRTELARSSCR